MKKVKKAARLPVIGKEELVRRAYRAWFSGRDIDWFDEKHFPKPNETRSIWMPNTPNTAEVEEHDGHYYVVLREEKPRPGQPNPRAVYRVKNDGMLKRLRRWPAGIDGGER